MKNSSGKNNWKDFHSTGLLWFVNRMLHVFGWAINVAWMDDEVIDVYPIRTKTRGFDEKTEEESYERVAKWMKDSGEELYDEANYKESS